jgi:beta-glucosidase
VKAVSLLDGASLNHGTESQSATLGARDAQLARRFPRGFVWGVATSAFQIEGATREDDRGDSIWDAFCRRPGVIKDGSSGDPACDHYHRSAEDVDLIAELGIPAYRFSIAWPRVQPTGAGPWNDKGFAFYQRLVDRLLSRGIAPHVTLYHWDLPQALQAQGGWTNRETAERFAEYAAEVGRRLGGAAATISTLNEPWVIATLGHETGVFAPGEKSRRAAMQVSHHLLLGHGLAAQALRALGLRTPLGIVLNQSPTYPATASDRDRAQARIDDGLAIRWYMDPLFAGSYPADIVEYLGTDAPEVRAGDLQVIGQPLDFLGINYYTRGIAGSAASADALRAGSEFTAMGWEVFPQGLTALLGRLHADYRLPPLYITENGAAYDDRPCDGRVADVERVRYLRAHVEALAEALDAGVDVRGYFVWSLFDNFEWAEGYSKRFGIVHVDYASQVRTPKDSALWYRRFVAECAHPAAQAGTGPR